MQLKNDLISKNNLDEIICEYYRRVGGRSASNFLRTEDEKCLGYDTYFLVDRRHVIRYGISEDRGTWLGAVSLAIGPHYFGAADFWSYENFRRFTLEASTEGVVKNLALLDEFWGYEKGGRSCVFDTVMKWTAKPLPKLHDQVVADDSLISKRGAT